MSVQYSTAKAKVERDLDLEEENFIQDEEMLEYFNEALREAEAEVLAIYEDYLLDSASLALVIGTSKYDLPNGIYASKIRGVIYSNGSIIYEIKRIRSAHKFLDRALLRDADPTDYYQYIIVNNSTTGIQIELSPAAKETSSSNVTVWFIREVDEIVDDTDLVDKDIPESINFIYAYVKARCKQKENAGQMPPDAQAELEKQRSLMIETLTTMVPDDDNEVIKDLSFYNEIS